MKDYSAFFRDSYRRITHDPGTRGDFIERFYERFTAASPEVARRFQLTDMRQQQLMLTRSLDEMARFAARREASESLRRTAEHHGPRDLDIPAGLYDLWLTSLLETVREFDPNCSDEVILSWRIMLAPGIEYMKHKPADPV